ncbi:unnamed protein product [marine sediment metagenome]|uniref:Beta-ketoacyl synthase-like N-terminal domain-containing protein n=1 Tax=marine sediment metagenome TaxID=412755 RepID=X1NC83_9ZZZZ
MSMPRVVVTGMGTVNPLGLNVEEFWQGLVAGKSGIGLITRFDASNFYVKVDAEVKNFDPTKYMDLKAIDRSTRAVQFAVAAAKEAIKSAELDMTEECPERVGVSVGCMVESSYVVSHLLHHSLHCIAIPNISFNWHSFPTLADYSFHYTISIRLIISLNSHVIDRHLGTKAGKLQGNGSTHTSRGASYQRYFAF